MSAELYIISGISLFLGLHILTGLHEWRQAALNKLGLLPYRILFSLGTLYAFWTILKGFDARPFDMWWEVPHWATFAPMVIMPISLFLFICHFTSHSQDNFSRQPLGWAIILWALSHLIANGESGTTVFFGGFLLYGVLAIHLRERKAKLGDTTASHGGNEFDVKLAPFTRLPRGVTGKKFAFLLFTTAVVDFVLIRIHEIFIGVSATSAVFG